MKFGLLLAGVMAAGTALMLGGTVQAAPQGAIVVADNDKDKDKDKDHAKVAPPKGGTPPKPVTPHDRMGPPAGQMGGHGSNMMGGHMNGQMGGGMTGHAVTPQNFDRHTYQRNVTATRHFHIAVYNRPSGWYAHRWVFGEILPALFWSQNYWLPNYLDYGLGDPPPGFVWVRYGDDAPLIDQNSGEVLQVDYGVFD